MSRGESAMMVQRGDNEAGNHSQTCAGCMRVGQCIFGGHRLQLSSPDLAIHVVIAHSFGSLSSDACHRHPGAHTPTHHFSAARRTVLSSNLRLEASRS